MLNELRRIFKSNRVHARNFIVIEKKMIKIRTVTLISNPSFMISLRILSDMPVTAYLLHGYKLNGTLILFALWPEMLKKQIN